MNIFITGIDGFVGSFLAELLIGENMNVWGLVRSGSSSHNIKHIERKLNLIEGDLEDIDRFRHIVSGISPDVIVHLGGQSLVSVALEDPYNTFRTNIIGGANILEAVRIEKPDTKVIVIISADVYGSPAKDILPLKEDAPLRPTNPYSASKAALDIITQQYAFAYGLNVVIARTFNLIGPRQHTQFVASDFARQVAAVKLGLTEPRLTVGNLTSRRDFLDVRDAVEAYYLMATNPTPHSVYNICTGRSILVRSLLDKLIDISTMDISIEIDPTKLRKIDTPELVGDPSLASDEIGFLPDIRLEKSLADILEWWEKQLTEQPELAKQF